MKIYEHEGKQYVETGERTVKGGKSKIGTVYNWSVMGDDHVGIVTEDGTWGYENKILRLATPEEMKGAEPHAGSEKKCFVGDAPNMCPSGCGAKYGAHHEAPPYKCPWLLAFNNHFDKDTSFSKSMVYADIHWRDFLPKQVHAGVRLSPESAGKAFRTRGGWKATVTEILDNGGIQNFCVRHNGSNGRQRHNEDGSWASIEHKDPLDLISEWDEKAEAGAGNMSDVGSRSQDGESARKSDAPAQPIPADAAGFYQWMWGYPQPFEVGLKPEPVRVPCACCKGSGRAKQSVSATDSNGRKVQFAVPVTCPECQGSGEQAGR